MIKTVGEFINILDKFDPTMDIRCIVNQGELSGIKEVIDAAGRATIVPANYIPLKKKEVTND